MTERKKHNIIIIVYLAVAAVIFGAAAYLGFIYVVERTVNPPGNEISVSGETESAETESDLTETEYTETEETEESDESAETEETESETEFIPTEPKDKLIYLFENAPYRWAKRGTVEESDIVTETETETEPESETSGDENTDTSETETEIDRVTETEPETESETSAESESETAETEEELVLVYPKVAYAYYNLVTGDTLTYNADEILYSASLIKAPYIYSVFDEIEKFEKNKHDYDVNGNLLYDEEGNPLFEGRHPNYDENGKIIYLPGEEKYNLDEIWTFDKENMNVEGSGEIQWKDDGFQLTWKELFDYTLRFSDNVAFAQIRQRFGYSSFYTKVWQLGIEGTSSGFMDLTANDCVKFLREMYNFFDDSGKYAEIMKRDMITSIHTVMICKHYPYGTVAHKYGWDLKAFHDMAIIYDEVPYLLVIMTDYEDGDSTALNFIADAVAITKEVHEKFSADIDREALKEAREEHEKEIAERKEKESAEMESWLTESEADETESEQD